MAAEKSVPRTTRIPEADDAMMPHRQGAPHAIPEAPADAILRIATETGADIIVIGNRGAQGARRVLGSVASAIVGHAPCSVFVVKTS